MKAWRPEVETRRAPEAAGTRRTLAVAGVLAVLLSAAATPAATPIGNGSPTSLPPYSGAAWKAARVKAKKPPKNKYMATNIVIGRHGTAYLGAVGGIVAIRDHK